MNDLDNFYDEVAKVAYDLFEKRGWVHGHDMADWLQAEMIVKKRYSNENERDNPVARSKDKSKKIRENRRALNRRI